LRRRYAAACRGAMAISLEIRSGARFRRGTPTVAGSAGTRQRSGSDLPRHIGPAGGARCARQGLRAPRAQLLHHGQGHDLRSPAPHPPNIPHALTRVGEGRVGN